MGADRKTELARRRAYIRKKRRRKRTVFFLLLFLLTFAALFAAVRVFFQIETIKVENSVTSVYTGDEIKRMSGLLQGDNLFSFRKSEIESRLLSSLPYLGNVTVSRKLPGTVVISVFESTDFFSVPYRGGYLIVSKEMKIVSDTHVQPMTMPLVYGLSPKSFAVGKMLQSENHAAESLETLLAYLSVYNWFDQVTAISVREKLDLSFVYQNRIFVRIGSPSKMEYKFSLLQKVLDDELAPAYKGNLDLSIKLGYVYESSGEMRFPSGYFAIEGVDGTEQPLVTPETDVFN